MKATPAEEEQGSAPDLAAKALDAELNASGSASAPINPAVVNDLTSIVKKKKKAPAGETNGSKRKADEEAGSNEKKARLDEQMQL
jgi:HAT1-interacting factor 1